MSNNRNVRASETRSQVRAEEERPDTAWTPRFRVEKLQTMYINVCVQAGVLVLLIL